MLSEEEKKAIELAKNFIKIDFTTPNGWTGYYDRELNEISKAINILLNIITKYKKENEEKDKQINELVKYVDNNNYVDNEECQFQYDFKIERCIEKGDCKNCIKSHFEKLSKEKEGVKDEHKEEM